MLLLVVLVSGREKAADVALTAIYRTNFQMPCPSKRAHARSHIFTLVLRRS